MSEKKYIDADKEIAEIETVLAIKQAEGDDENNIGYYALMKFAAMLRKAPAADVEEVRHGKWITITVPRHDPHGEKFWLCTNCERAWRKELLVDIASGDFPKRCPECGAYMNKEKEE